MGGDKDMRVGKVVCGRSESTSFAGEGWGTASQELLTQMT